MPVHHLVFYPFTASLTVQNGVGFSVTVYCVWRSHKIFFVQHLYHLAKHLVRPPRENKNTLFVVCDQRRRRPACACVQAQTSLRMRAI